MNEEASFSGTTTIQADQTITNAEGDKHFRSDFSAITGTNKNISSVLLCRLFRNSSHINDTYDNGTALALLIDIDFHYEIDMIGSRLLATKS